MPIYEYQCRQCGQEFELLVLNGTLVACPSCQSRELEPLLSGFAVSSDGSRTANAQSARQAAVHSREQRDKSVAHSEYVKKHAKE
ncbi:MAG TPA: FmdB family zinc ribbon protein [Bryobacteraceae bacterium]|jgi:putative FmdB family regulatory protein|nr:FmdB family zinc ribbon protein [Bryobacteraceae bacterium]